MLTSVNVKIHVLYDIMLSWVYSFQHLKRLQGASASGQSSQEKLLLGCLSLKDKTSRLSWNVGNYQSMLCNIPEEPTFHILWTHNKFCILLKIIFHIIYAFGVTVFFLLVLRKFLEPSLKWIPVFMILVFVMVLPVTINYKHQNSTAFV